MDGNGEGAARRRWFARPFPPDWPELTPAERAQFGEDLIRDLGRSCGLGDEPSPSVRA